MAFDEAGRWLTIERGDPGGTATFTAANYGSEAITISLPSAATGWELALATVPGSPVAGTISLPPGTGAIFARPAG